MNDHQRDPFDLGLDFRDAVRPAPPAPWRANAVDGARTAPPPSQAQHAHYAPRDPYADGGSFPGTWPRNTYASQPAPSRASYPAAPQPTPSWTERPRHIDSEACGVLARSIEAQVLIPTARPSYKAGFDRRELKALAAAAVTGLTLAGAMAATLLHTSTPPPAPAAAVAVVAATPPPPTPGEDEEGPSLLARLGQTADAFADAATELEAGPAIDLDLDEEPPEDLDDAEEEEAEEDEEAEAEEAAPRVSSSRRRSSRKPRRMRKNKKKKADEKKEKKKDAEPEPPKVDGPLKDFNPNAARSALSRAAGAASGCGEPGGPSGRARVSVTFAPNGTVASASVGAPFAGTSTGRCIVSAFRGMTMTPFRGSPMSLPKSVFIRTPDADTTSTKKKKRKKRRRR